MKNSFLRSLKPSAILILLGITLAAVILGVTAHSYFSERVFYLDLQKYKKASELSEVTIYKAWSGKSLEVHTNDSGKTVLINKEEYKISGNPTEHGFQYKIMYPNGRLYTVEDQYGSLTSYNDNGEFVPEFAAYVNGLRIINEGDERYFPSFLVSAAYPQYHTSQGSQFLFFLSVGLFIYGWCSFRYERLQRIQFFLSLRWIWVQDGEPSDFYFFMCKVGGIAVMLMSIYFLIRSFFF
jgi:hypothetical protein